MIRASTVRSVAAFEFVSTVLRKGYLISTFGMPLFVMLYGGIIAIPGWFISQEETKVKIYGVIDRPAILQLSGDEQAPRLEIPEHVQQAIVAAGQSEILDQTLALLGNEVFRPFDDEQAARTALLADEIRGFYVVPEDYLESGRVDVFSRQTVKFDLSDARRSLGAMIRARLLEGRIEPEVAARVGRPITETERWIVRNDGGMEKSSPLGMFARLIIPIAFTMLLFISIMMSAGYLIQGTAIEKENKVVEVLLSSANPDEILTGKLFGLGGAGLLQVGVWFGMLVFTGVLFAGTLATFGVDVPWGAMAASLPFFLGAYLFLGSLMLGTGSLGNNMRESQQWSMVWSLLSVIPLMFLGLLITNPHHTAAKIMTWIPFTSPVTVILRMTMDPDGIAWWEIGGALLVLATSIWLAIRFGARLFRVGLLLTGARPKLREILRQARLAG